MTRNSDKNPPDVAELTPLVYRELRQIAAAYLRRERPGQTLQATALVHEAYLRLAGAGSPWRDERHFVGIAARSMRQILVDRARARGAQKRWAELDRVTLSASLAAATNPESMLPAVDEALTRLEQIRSGAGANRRASLFRRPGHRRSRVGARYLAGDTQASLGARPCLAVSRVERRTMTPCTVAAGSGALRSSARRPARESARVARGTVLGLRGS